MIGGSQHLTAHTQPHFLRDYTKTIPKNQETEEEVRVSKAYAIILFVIISPVQ
jgi:hypothetical protein